MTPPSVQRRRNGLGRRWHGTATIEMVLVGMLLIELTFFSIEFSWLFLRKQQVINTARQAARIAATVDATNGQVSSQISSQLTSYGMGGSGYTATLSPADISTATKGQTVSVTISIPYANIQATPSTMGLWTTFHILPSTVQSTVTMVKEGE
jgi:Flp pilus assembly protein TadG